MWSLLTSWRRWEPKAASPHGNAATRQHRVRDSGNTKREAHAISSTEFCAASAGPSIRTIYLGSKSSSAREGLKLGAGFPKRL
jgi:hypothetical protein